MTETQVEASVAFARYLNRYGINSENFWLFMRLILTNNPWVIDELLIDREPRLLFSTIRPEAELIEAAFEALFSRHPEELYPKALEALIGVIQSAYFDPDDGFRIRKLSIMDINALGKFLKKNEPQDEAHNKLILEVLDRITHLGEYYGEPDKNVLAKHAFNVRFAYFDSTRNLVDAIPGPLLVRFPDRGGVQPEEDYADLVSRRRERKRDAQGRFVRRDAEEAPAPKQAESASPANRAPVETPAAAPAPAPNPTPVEEPVEKATIPAAAPARPQAKAPPPAQKPASKIPTKPAAKPSADKAKPAPAKAAPAKGPAAKPAKAGAKKPAPKPAPGAKKKGRG